MAFVQNAAGVWHFMASGREIRLRISLDSSGVRADPAKLEAAGAEAGVAFSKGFSRTAGRATVGPDGVIVVNRGSTAGRATVGPGGVISLGPQANTGPSKSQTMMQHILGNAPTAAGAAVSRLATLYSLLGGAAGAAGKIIGGIPKAVTGISIAFAGLGGAITTVRAIGFALDQGLIKPLGRVGDQFVDALEKSRKFELAISGVVGQSRARQLNYALVGASRNQPADVASLRATGAAFSALPALASRLNDPNAAGQIVQLNRLVSRLSTLDPAQGTDGALIAVRELLEGGGGQAFTSLRRRFGLSGNTLAKALGKNLSEVTQDPQLALAGLEKIVNTLIPDNVIDRSGSLFTVKVQKIRDALDQALVRVGDSGSFDHLVAKVGGVADQLFAALDGPTFAAQARKVSDAVGRAMDSIGSSIERFLRAATGAKADQPLVEVVGDAIAIGVDRLSKVIDNLPAIAEKIGAGVGVITDNVGRLVDALTDIADATRNPGKVADRLGDYVKLRATGYLVNTDLNALGTDAGNGLVGMLDAIGRRGQTSAPATQPTTLPSAGDAVPTARWGKFSDLVGSLDTKGNGLPSFGTTLLGGNAAAGRLDDLTREQDKLSELASAGRGAFVSSADVVERLRKQFIEAADAFDDGLAEGELRLKLATDPQEVNQLRGLLDSTRRVREQLVDAFHAAGSTAADALTDSARDFRRGLANSLADLPLAGPDALQAAAGRNAQIESAMKRLSDIGVQGGPTELHSWQLDDRQNFWSRLADRGLSDLDSQSRIGAFSIGATPQQIDLAARVRPDDRMIKQRQADLIENQLLPGQAGLLRYANARLAANPGDPLAIRDASKAAEQYGKLAAQLADLKDAVGELGPAFRQFSDSARSSIESGLGSAISSLIKGTGSLREAFAAMADAILNDFSQMSAHLIVQGLVGDLGRQQSSNQSGSTGGLLSILGSAASNYFSARASASASAGSTAAMADGGILSRPTLTLAGEAGMEAFVPMRGGRIPLGMTKSGQFFAKLPKGGSIPAELHGGSVTAFANGGVWAGRGPAHLGGGFVSSQPAPAFDASRGDPRIFVVSDMDAAVRAGLRKHQDIVVSAVTGNIAKGGAIRKAMR